MYVSVWVVEWRAGLLMSLFVLVDSYRVVFSRALSRSRMAFLSRREAEVKRAEICKIVSEMLDNPDDCGIVETGKAYNALEKLVSDAYERGYFEACIENDVLITPEMEEMIKERVANSYLKT